MTRPCLKFSTAQVQSLEMKFSNIVMQFRRAGQIFFHKVISKSTATQNVVGSWGYALEFPFPFVQEYGDLFSINVTFERWDSDRRWPIKLNLQESRQIYTVQSRVFAYGEGGWKDFLIDNKIRVGDVVFFIWLQKSRFLVQTLEESLKNIDDASPCPRFLVTVGPSHAGPVHVKNEEQESSSLEVPGSFWKRHRRMLRGDKLRLQGPNSKPAVMVKAVRTYHLEDEQEPKLSVRLERGWKVFFDANQLRLGDTLRFSLVQPMCFKVDLLDRGK